MYCCQILQFKITDLTTVFIIFISKCKKYVISLTTSLNDLMPDKLKKNKINKNVV